MSGSMFAVEQEDGVTGHLVLVSKELLLVFVREGRKLSQCDRYDDVTSDVTCQVSKSPGKVGPPVRIAGRVWAGRGRLVVLRGEVRPACEARSGD